MKLTRKELRNLIKESYMDNLRTAREMYRGSYVNNQFMPAAAEQELIDLAQSLGIIGLTQGVLMQLNPVDKMKIHNMLKSGDVDYQFIQSKIDAVRGFSRDMSAGRYGSLDEAVGEKEIKIKDIEKAVRKCLEKEGGAAGMGLLVKSVKELETKTKKLPKKLRTNKQIAKCILKMDFVVKHRY